MNEPKEPLCQLMEAENKKNLVSRRGNLKTMVPAELAIMKAIEEVECLFADTRLTDAIFLLNDAINKVGDFVDELST